MNGKAINAFLGLSKTLDQDDIEGVRDGDKPKVSKLDSFVPPEIAQAQSFRKSGLHHPRAITDWRPVNRDSVAQLWQVYRNDLGLQACRNVIMNKLLSHGCMFADINYNRTPSPEFFAHVNSRYVPFIREFIDCMIVQGYVVFSWSNWNQAPNIVPNRTGQVKHRFMDDYSREVAFFPNGSEEPSTYVFVRVEQHPGEDGEFWLRKPRQNS